MANKKMIELGECRSAIRDLFEYGLKRKAEVGAENVYDFSLGNPSIPAPEKVNRTLIDLLEHTEPTVLHGYSSAAGDPEVRKAVAESINARFGTKETPGDIYMTCGAAASLTISLHALLDEGEEVITVAPYFPEYKVFIEKANGVMRSVPAREKDFAPDLEKLEQALNSRTGAVILNSPNNPSGAVISEEDLCKIAALLQKASEKQGDYSVKTGITSENKLADLPAQIHDINFKTGYIPEGMKWADESHLEYPQSKRMGGFSFASVLLDSDDLNQALENKNVVESEERTFGKYEGVYLKYNNLKTEKGVFDQRIYLLCPDEYRVITIYIGDDVSKEDAVKVAENLEITENDKMLETAKMYTWSDEVNPNVETGDEMVTSVSEDKLKVYKIGEDFTLSASGEDKDGNNIVNDKISAHVDSVQTADDLKLLNGADLPEEWENVINSNGKLVKNKVSYIKSGDGVNSVDRVIKTENVNQKLVYATVTYTNNSDQEIKHMLYIGNLALIRHENGEYHIYNAMEQSGNGYDRVSWDGVAHTAEMTYSSVREDYGNGGNYISSLKPGESIQVNMAWIVNENDLADMYLNLDGEGGAYDFGEGMLEAGVVDIRK